MTTYGTYLLLSKNVRRYREKSKDLCFLTFYPENFNDMNYTVKSLSSKA